MRSYLLKNNFAMGEVNPDLILREDVQSYHSAAEGLANCRLWPEGKASRAPGLRYRRRHRRVLEAVVPETDSGVSGDPIGTTDPFEVQAVTFDTAPAISFVDVEDIALSAGASTGEFRIQYSTDGGGNWADFGTPFDVTTDLRTRRRFSASGAVTAADWRLVRIGSTDLDAATVSLAALAFWRETATLSAARRFRFAASQDARYRVVASDRNLAIFGASGVELANIPIPHTAAQLADISWTQSFDTALIFHEDVAPWRIFRQGDDDEFDARYQDFENIPRFEYGLGTGGLNEIQILRKVGGTGANTDVLEAVLEGLTSNSFNYNTNAATFAANIQNALNGLQNVAGDITVASSGTNEWTVTFAGRDGNRDWGEVRINLLSGSPTFATLTTQRGQPTGEAVMSDTRGWPRCGVFHSGRLLIGGFKSLPDGWCGSVVGEYFNLDDRTDRDDRGFLRRLQGDRSGTIRQLFTGQKLLIFTDLGTFYQPSEPITPDNAAPLATNERGVSRVPVVKCDDAPLMVTESGQVLEVVYSDNEQRFRGEPISVLSTHLFSAPVDAAARMQNSASEPNLYAVVNGDGTLAVLSSLRSQNLTGWVPRRTNGKFLAVGDDLLGEFWYVTERTLGGVTDRFIESEDENLFTDCAETVTVTPETGTAGSGQTVIAYSFTSPASEELVGVQINGKRLAYGFDYTVDLDAKEVTLTDALAAGDSIRVCAMLASISGLERFNGAEVWAVVDGNAETAPKTVSGGSIMLDRPADSEVEVGLAFVPQIDLLPARPELANGTAMGRSMRICAVTLDVEDTAFLEMQANGGPWRTVSFRKHGAGLLDVAVNSAGYTGEKRIEGLRGWSRAARVSLRQTRPGKFAVRGLAQEAVL